MPNHDKPLVKPMSSIYTGHMNTPFFPAWRPRLAPMGSRSAHALRQVRAYTLCQLESCFAPWLPKDLFPKARDKENSRDSDYTRTRTFWCMLWQALNPGVRELNQYLM